MGRSERLLASFEETESLTRPASPLTGSRVGASWMLGPRKLRTSDGQASDAESFLLRSEAPHQINAAIVAATSSKDKTTGPQIQAISAEHGLAEIGRLQSGLELAQKVVPWLAVTDSLATFGPLAVTTARTTMRTTKRGRSNAEKDVVIIGIHTPDRVASAVLKRIKSEAAKNGLKFPIAVDNDGSNWRAWNNRYWPTVYVVDRRGRVRYGWEGELNYKGASGEEKVRKLVDSLLLERP